MDSVQLLSKLEQLASQLQKSQSELTWKEAFELAIKIEKIEVLNSLNQNINGIKDAMPR